MFSSLKTIASTKHLYQTFSKISLLGVNAQIDCLLLLSYPFPAPSDLTNWLIVIDLCLFYLFFSAAFWENLSLWYTIILLWHVCCDLQFFKFYLRAAVIKSEHSCRHQLREVVNYSYSNTSSSFSWTYY